MTVRAIVGPRFPILAVLVADFTAGALFAAYTYLSDESGLRGPEYAVLLLLMAMAISLLIIVVLALPLFFLLAGLRLVNVWTTLAAGLVIGFAIASVTEWPQTGFGAFWQGGWNDHSVRRMCAHAVIGAISALGFWLTLARKQGKD